MPAFPKFPHGTTWREEKHARKTARESGEKAAKQQAKRLDGGRCRWPHCDCRTVKQPLESAHVKAKGMGGTPTGERNDQRNLITLCHTTHRGPRSLHSGDRRITPLTEDGARGPCQFEMTDEHGRWFVVAVEREPFIYLRD